MKISTIINDLKYNFNCSSEELDYIQDVLEEYGEFCYRVGYDKRCEEVEQYYAGFSYGKKSEMDEYE